MDSVADPDVERERRQPIDFPDALGGGATVLVAGSLPPSAHAVCLRTLSRFGDHEDSALVVTTRESADDTVGTWERLSAENASPSLGVVDTTSEHQSLAATYGDVPTFFTPSSGDVERIVMALSELSVDFAPGDRSRHLAIRSLTPILAESSTERVSRVLERIGGLRSTDGLGLFGIDYTAHDRETLSALADTVDGVVWITRTETGRIDCEYRTNRGRPRW